MAISCALVQYAAVYYISIPIVMQTQEVIFSPEDNTLVSILNFTPTENEDNIYLEQEKYKIKLKFLNVAETNHNMMQGNLYLSAKLISNLPSVKPI